LGQPFVFNPSPDHHSLVFRKANSMTHVAYVPLLKARQGELSALAEVDSIGRNRITPLIDVAPWAPTDKAPTVLSFIEGMVERLRVGWSQTGPVWLDTSQIGASAYTQGDPHSIIMRAVDESGLKLVPVVRPDPRELDRVAEIGIANGICVRLRPSDFAGDVGEAIAKIIDAAGVGASLTDVIVDLGAVDERADETAFFAARQMLLALPHPAKLRSIVLAASSFPVDLSAIPGHGETYVRRGEWALWKRIRDKVPFTISFGDYGISHPAFPGPVKRSPPPSVRYTTPEDYYLVKRRAAMEEGEEPRRDLARDLITTPEYRQYGPEFSWGDAEIMRYAEKQERGPRGSGWGGGMEWRKIGTSHHLAVVVYDLSTLV
jgi:Beta protein